jgi:hypothetical protein
MKLDLGRWIAYGGGSGVSLTSTISKAQEVSASITPSPGDVMTVLNYPLIQIGGVQLVTADIVSIGGLTLVAARLAFDVWKYLDARKRSMRGKDDGAS